ncbi:MAG: hypothetical protein ACQERZ_05035 [Fusobacteriota bacterium]
MKTIIILLILAFPVYFALKKVYEVLTGQDSPCSCDSDTCSDGSCPLAKK